MTNKFLKNGLYNVAAGAIRIGLAVITIPILIRLLGIEEYGLWTLASAVMGMIGLADAGLSTATTVFVSKDLANEDTEGLSQTLTVTVGSMLILATIAAIALWFGAEPIVKMFPKLGQVQSSVVIQALQVGALVVWTKLLQQVLIGIEQAYQRYGLLNILNSIQWILLSSGLFAVASFGGRTVTLMQWQAFISIGTLLSHIWVVRLLLENANIRPFWNLKKGIAIAHYSLATWLTILGTVIFSKGDRLIVASLLGSQVVGIYSAIVEITSVINSFSALPIQPIISTFSYLVTHQDNQKNALQQQLKQAIQLNAIVAFALGSVLLTLSPVIFKLIIPLNLTQENILIFQISTIIYSLYSVNAVGYFVLFTINAVKVSMLNILVSSILSISLIFIGSKLLGLVGAILGNGGYLVTLLLPVFALKKMNISPLILFDWLKIPTLFFLCLIIISMLLPRTIGWNYYQPIGILILIIFSIFAPLWFYLENKINVKAFMYKC